MEDNEVEAKIFGECRIRLAEDADEEFLRALYATTRSDEFVIFGWSSEQFAAFCAMQFEMQTRSYKMQYPDAVNWVVEHGPTPAGRLLVNIDAAEIGLVDISLLPEFRGRGIGKNLILNLIREAEAAGKPLHLSVSQMNVSARRLYERLGFRVIEESETHLSMQWRSEDNN